MHQFLKLILFCSGTLHVSDGLSVRHLAFHLVPASKQSAESVWHIPDAACTVLDSWWWTERTSETCRVLLQNKINLRYCASGWFYYRNILRCTVLQTSNLLYTYDLFHYAVSISEYTSADCRVINERESGKNFRGSLSDLSEVIFHNLTVRTETNHETFSWPPKHLPECTSDELPLELICSAKDAKKKKA
jgi:hypothetical protein